MWFRGMRFGDAEYIHLHQDGDKRRALVDTTINTRIP
jgi:hypothetical protein